MKIDIGKQRLLFQGKQLEDTYSLYDYDVKVKCALSGMCSVDYVLI